VVESFNYFYAKWVTAKLSFLLTHPTNIKDSIAFINAINYSSKVQIEYFDRRLRSLTYNSLSKELLKNIMNISLQFHDLIIPFVFDILFIDNVHTQIIFLDTFYSALSEYKCKL